MREEKKYWSPRDGKICISYYRRSSKKLKRSWIRELTRSKQLALGQRADIGAKRKRRFGDGARRWNWGKNLSQERWPQKMLCKLEVGARSWGKAGAQDCPTDTGTKSWCWDKKLEKIWRSEQGSGTGKTIRAKRKEKEISARYKLGARARSPIWSRKLTMEQRAREGLQLCRARCKNWERSLEVRVRINKFYISWSKNLK